MKRSLLKGDTVDISLPADYRAAMALVSLGLSVKGMTVARTGDNGIKLEQMKHRVIVGVPYQFEPINQFAKTKVVFCGVDSKIFSHVPHIPSSLQDMEAEVFCGDYASAWDEVGHKAIWLPQKIVLPNYCRTDQEYCGYSRYELRSNPVTVETSRFKLGKRKLEEWMFSVPGVWAIRGEDMHIAVARVTSANVVVPWGKLSVGPFRIRNGGKNYLKISTVPYFLDETDDYYRPAEKGEEPIRQRDRINLYWDKFNGFFRVVPVEMPVYLLRWQVVDKVEKLFVTNCTGCGAICSKLWCPQCERKLVLDLVGSSLGTT